jgi:PadR family transcriptional regulator, regulatory protein PadR
MGDAPIRMTLTTQAVLRAFLEDPTQPRYGLELGSMTALPSGTVHPILARLEGIGWVTSSWENIDSAAVGRPRRRYYKLSDEGLAASRMALAGAYAARASHVRMRPAEGLT